MEKRTPHYRMELVRKLIRQGQYLGTRTAMETASDDFHLDKDFQLAECVLNLAVRDFYKSMTSFHDSKTWQDVYKSQVCGIKAYIKIQILNESTVILSFKRWGK